MPRWPRLSLDQGYPGETQSVLQKAFSENVFTEQRDKDRYQHLLDGAKQRAAADLASLPKQEQDAANAPQGDKLVQVGAAYMSYGQNDKAIADIQKGIAKGSLKYPDEANVLLGIAQLRSHNAADAQRSFEKVDSSSNPGYARLGKLWATARSARRASEGVEHMTIKAGDRMPEGKFKMMGEKGPKDLTTAQLFDGKRVVLFSVPGAFTPTCDAKHLPGYVGLAEKLRAKGIDTIACMAVNDVFVMNAWGKASNVGDKVLMLADGNGEYARALGLELDGRGFGMGMRGQRFAILVDKGVATQVEIEAPGQFKVSSAEHVLAKL